MPETSDLRLLDASKPTTVLVTGATGFVGRALIPALTAAGFEVRAAVRGSCPPAGRFLWAEGSGARAPERRSVELIRIDDIGPATRWNEALAGVDAVVHLAARVHVMEASAREAIAEYRRVNTAGTERLALAAAAAGVRRFVFLSTIKVNGEATRARPFAESDPPVPQDPYARSKWEAEQALHRIGAQTGMEVVILRPPLVYGPGVKGNFLSLLKIVARGVPLPLGSVKNRRSLIYVGNLADAIVKCLEHPAAAGETFLVRDAEDLSTPELVRRLACALGVAPRLIPVPPSWLVLGGRWLGRGAAVERLAGSLAVDDSRIRDALGWHPPYSVDEGLEATGRWYRERARSSEKRRWL
ncbi:UDP-glucose 4-epimerase family protein [Pelomicrobium methylotrophicum]|uniref:UDP-glucose 4-epimerase family protein n=1 Tax=Pelomicrobium methylotrophicum TaxID=2602750 RepID=UPI001F4475FA|nr:SDR family oxidoreductase [Pelomicrobium methylotrophicum]